MDNVRTRTYEFIEPTTVKAFIFGGDKDLLNGKMHMLAESQDCEKYLVHQFLSRQSAQYR